MLAALFEIKNNDVVSIVGSGGKTSLMFYLSKQFPALKTLITTSTKILLPKEKDFDFLHIGEKNINDFLVSPNKGRYVLGQAMSQAKHKIVGFDAERLSQAVRHFDLSFIESDGSKQKLLKGWNETEPVVIASTTKTIGVINLKLLGQEATEQNIHRLTYFKRLITNQNETTITASQIKEVVLHEKGLFKNAVGDKILFINQVDCKADNTLALSFLDGFTKTELQSFNKIIVGSVQNEEFSIYLQR